MIIKKVKIKSRFDCFPKTKETFNFNDILQKKKNIALNMR